MLILLLLFPSILLATVTVDGVKIEGQRLYNLKGVEVKTAKEAAVIIHTQTIDKLRYLHIKRSEILHGPFEKAVAFYNAFGKRCDNKLIKKRYFLKTKNPCDINQDGMIEYTRLKNISHQNGIDHFIAGISTYNSFKVGPFPIKELARTYQEYKVELKKNRFLVNAKILNKDDLQKKWKIRDNAISTNPIYGHTEITLERLPNNKISMEIIFVSKIDHRIIEMGIATGIIYKQAFKTTANPFKALQEYLNSKLDTRNVKPETI